jgi:hypothetical protein
MVFPGSAAAYAAAGKSHHDKPARLHKAKSHNRKRRGDDLMTLVQASSASAQQTTTADVSQCVQRQERFKTLGAALIPRRHDYRVIVGQGASEDAPSA